MTTRRHFLKGVAAGAIAAAVPLPKAPSVFAAGGEFIPAGAPVYFVSGELRLSDFGAHVPAMRAEFVDGELMRIE